MSLNLHLSITIKRYRPERADAVKQAIGAVIKREAVQHLAMTGEQASGGIQAPVEA